MILLYIFAIYLCGALITHILDGWFNFSKDDKQELKAITWLWPLAWLFAPFVFAGWIHDKLRSARKRVQEKKVKQEKIRIAAEKELEKIIDEELSTEVGKRVKQC